jgi:hypothetical protein
VELGLAWEAFAPVLAGVVLTALSVAATLVLMHRSSERSRSARDTLPRSALRDRSFPVMLLSST